MKRLLTIAFVAVTFFANSAEALEIVEVKVGAGDAWLDATDAFKKAKASDDFYCGWFVGSTMAGKDPAPGKVKQIVVTYTDDDGSTQTRMLEEKAFAAVAANTPPPTEAFTFGRAFWGDKGKFVEVTDRVRALLTDRKEVFLTNQALGATDPLPGKVKFLIVFHSLRGVQHVDSFKEKTPFKASLIDGSFDPVPLAKEVRSPFSGMALDTAAWQWSIDMAGTRSPENGLPSKAFLYIPEKTRKVRGVVVGQYNMLERPIMEHPMFREYLQRLDYGCIWIAPTPFAGKPRDSAFDFRNSEHAGAVDRMFRDLAAVSGYAELAEIPFVGLGHSAMADFPYEMAAWKPERAIAGLSYDGTAPGVSYNHKMGENPILDDEALRRIEGIPFLFRSGGVGGQTNFRALVARNAYSALTLTMVMDPGSGHFDINDDIIDYMGKYLIRADRARGVGAGSLKRVDANSGWYVDYWRYNDPPKSPAAPVAEFKPMKGRHGDEANWVFDAEHARIHEAHEALYRGKKVQLLAYVQEGKILPDRKTHFQIHPKFIPEKDGLSFKLKGAFLDTVTDGRAPGWIGKKAGEAVEHGNDPENIRIVPAAGPVVRIDDETLALRFDRFGFTSSARTGGFSMIAVHPGDDVYRRCVLQSSMNVPVFHRWGARQYITFPPVPDVKAGTPSVKLAATCNTGMPVEYAVLHGPAYLKDGELFFTEIPSGARFPVEVAVAAWQYGTWNEPKLQSAQPVTITFNLVK